MEHADDAQKRPRQLQNQAGRRRQKQAKKAKAGGENKTSIAKQLHHLPVKKQDSAATEAKAQDLPKNTQPDQDPRSLSAEDKSQPMVRPALHPHLPSPCKAQ